MRGIPPRSPPKMRADVDFAPGARTLRAAEKREDLVAVCLIGPTKVLCRDFGDNRGSYPVKIVCTKGKPELAAKDTELNNPLHDYETLEYVKVESREHAERLKAALDGLLIGNQSRQENDQPKYHFRDILGCFDDKEQRYQWWIEIMAEAERVVLKQARQFQIYSPEQAQARVAGAARSFGRRR